MASEEAKSAWKRILESIENPENFDEDISMITNELNASAVVEDDGGYKARYDDLREKYRRRFGEMIEEINTTGGEEEIVEDEYKVESYDDLDFDGSTE